MDEYGSVYGPCRNAAINVPLQCPNIILGNVRFLAPKILLLHHFERDTNANTNKPTCQIACLVIQTLRNRLQNGAVHVQTLKHG